MNRINVCFALGVVGGLSASLATDQLLAQARYPDKAIRIVVAFPPGGGTDIMARLLGAKLAQTYGQQVVVENKTGGGGSIGTADVARAKPDGYTLIVGTTSTHAINPLTIKNLTYDAIKDFVPIYMLGTSTYAIVAHPNVARTLPELIKRVRASPGKYSFGSSGTGGSTHLAGELFKKQAGNLDIVHVPYRGSAQSVIDLASGQIPLIISGFSSVNTYHRSGRIRILAAFSEKRIEYAPEIPTAIEQGVPDMVAYTYNALFAPLGTPEAVVDQLYQTTLKIMTDPAFQKELQDLGIEAIADSSPRKATQAVKDELAKWTPVIKATGLEAR
jgi:tripartite-type tricarboxylate transporter receptor subunit TctC